MSSLIEPSVTELLEKVENRYRLVTPHIQKSKTDHRWTGTSYSCDQREPPYCGGQ